MNEFLGFRKMITPTVIQIIFWIGVAASVLFGLGLIIAGAAATGEASRYNNGYGGGGGVPGGLLVFAGLIEIVVGPILARINCELTILFFRIYETLVEIRDGSAAPVRSASGPAIDPAFAGRTV